MKKALVTGADGFIGSHLVEALVEKGFDVKALVLYNSFNSCGWLDRFPPDLRGEFEIVAGDVRDTGSVLRAVQGCDAVLHLASLIGIPYSYNCPESYIDTNVKGTLNVLEAARAANVSKLIHTSTSEVYGSAKFVPISESHPIVGQSPYSASKIAADQLAYSFFASFDMPISILRPFNTYGPRQSARAVIPTIIKQILSGEDRLKLGSQQPTRDFNYVEDTVDGFVACLQSTGGIGEVINLGSNFEISISDLLLMIEDIIGVQVEAELDEHRVRPQRSEVDRLWCDNSKALEILGWSPKYAGVNGLREGLIKTIAWFKKEAVESQSGASRYVI